LVGGILRFQTMVGTVQGKLGHPVNVPPDGLCQFTAALGAAVLGWKRVEKRLGAVA